MKMLFFLLGCLAASAGGTKFAVEQECRSRLGDITRVQFEGCPDGVDPCELEYGSTKNITVDFKYVAKFEVDDIRNFVRLKYADLEYDSIKGLDYQACRGKGLECPLQPGKSYTYQGRVEFRDDYPQPHYKLQWSLGNRKNTVWCTQINIRFYSKDHFY